MGSRVLTEEGKNHGTGLADCPSAADSLAFVLSWLGSADQVLELSLR